MIDLIDQSKSECDAPPSDHGNSASGRGSLVPAAFRTVADFPRKPSLLGFNDMYIRGRYLIRGTEIRVIDFTPPIARALISDMPVKGEVPGAVIAVLTSIREN